MKSDSYIGRLLLLFLAIYYLGIILLYSIFAYSNNINFLYIVSVIFILLTFIVIAYRLVLNKRTQLYILQLFILPFLLYSIGIGLAIFPFPALLTISVLVLISVVFLLSPFIFPKISVWINQNILHSNPKSIKFIFGVLLVIIIMAILFNPFIQSYIYQYMGEDITYIGGNLYLPISIKARNYAIFVDSYLIVLFGSLVISVIIKRNLD